MKRQVEGMTETESSEPTDLNAGRGRVRVVAVRPLIRQMAMIGTALAAWWLIYGQLAAVAEWATYGLLGIGRGSHLGDAVEFFLYDTPKVLMLLALVVFGVGVVRSFFTPERTRRILAAKRESVALHFKLLHLLRGINVRSEQVPCPGGAAGPAVTLLTHVRWPWRRSRNRWLCAP